MATGLSGLASGVDTSAIVEQLMALERQGKTRLQLRQTSLTAQQTTLTDLKTKLDGAQDRRGRPRVRRDLGARPRPSRAATPRASRSRARAARRSAATASR